MMKRLFEVILALVIGIILAMLVAPFAEAASRDRVRGWDKHSEGLFDGQFGVATTWKLYDAGTLDGLASDMGLEQPSDGMLLYTLSLMGRESDRVNIGGRLFWGQDRVTGGMDIDGNSFSRELATRFTGGGFIIEYTALEISRFEMSTAVLLGGGIMSVYLRQDDGTVGWDDVTGSYTGSPASTPANSASIRVTRSCFILQPEVTGRYLVLDWMAVEVAAGWQVDTLTREGWRYNEVAFSGKGPEVDFRQPWVRIGVVLGGR